LCCNLESTDYQSSQSENWYFAIQEIHQYLFPDLAKGGKLRQVDVNVGGNPTTDCRILPQEFLKFYVYLTASKFYGYEVVGNLHADFEMIHLL